MYQGHRIEVNEMGLTQAREMIRSRLPAIDERHADQLLDTFGGRPLALEHSCAYLRETGMPIDTYCQAVVRAPDKVLEAAGDRYGRTLTNVYRLAVEALDDSFDSLRLLDYLLFTPPRSMNLTMMAQLWVDSLNLPSLDVLDISFAESSIEVRSTIYLGVCPGVAHVDSIGVHYIDPMAVVTLQAAIRRLEDFGLVRSDRGALVIHQLTRSVLKSLRASQADNVYDKIRTRVYELISADNWKLSEAVPAERSMWVLHLLPALASLDVRVLSLVDEFTNSEIDTLVVLLSFAWRSSRQIGIGPSELLESTANLIAATSMRVWYGNERHGRADIANYFGFYRSFLDYLVGIQVFDTSQDGMLPTGERLMEPLVEAIRARLRQDTEWHLAHKMYDMNWPLSRLIGPKAPISSIDIASEKYAGSRAEAYKEAARVSVEFATIHYHAARWNDAIGALEHAYSCYLKIGADTECTRGVIDSARRLARVHLRAGSLNEATIWMMRAHWLHQERSEARPRSMYISVKWLTPLTSTLNS
jgi:uncharacterized protein YbcI